MGIGISWWTRKSIIHIVTIINNGAISHIKVAWPPSSSGKMPNLPLNIPMTQGNEMEKEPNAVFSQHPNDPREGNGDGLE